MSTSRIALAVFLICLSGCASRSSRHADETSKAGAGTDNSPAPPSWGTLCILSVADERPSRELGRADPLHRSYVSDRALGMAGAIFVKRELARALETHGHYVLSEDAANSKYVIRVRLKHLAANWQGGIAHLLPVLPTIAFGCDIGFDIELADQDGREFLRQTYRESFETSVSSFTLSDAYAAEELQRLTRTLCLRVAMECHDSVPRFWKSFGLPVSRKPDSLQARPFSGLNRAREAQNRLRGALV